MKNTDDLVVLQLNIRGVLSKTTLLTHLLNSCIEGRHPDIVLLSETWLTPNSPPVNIGGYSFVHKCRKNKKGGGIGILVSSKLRYNECNDIALSITENECVTIELQLKSKGKCIISSMYRPPNVDVQSFQGCYNSLICAMHKKNPKAIIVGLDHNLDFLKAGTHAGTDQFIQNNLDLNLMPTITHPTRITRKRATLIDNIIVSQNLCGNYCSSILVDNISDHLPSVCVIKSIQRVNKDPVEITSRDTSPKNMKALHEHLCNYQWDMLLNGKNVNDAMITFNDILSYEIDLCIPERTRLVQARNVRREPWITTSLKRSIDRCKRLYCKTLQANSDITSAIHYKAYNTTLKKAIRHAKQMFHQAKCKEYKTNTKKLWQLINRISGRMNDKSTSIDYLSIDGVREYNGNKIANSLAKYFATVGETFANKIPSATKSVDQYLRLLQSNENNLFLLPCTKNELNKIIQNLPNKKSSGVDQISNILLKQIGESILLPLSIIINESMSSGVFPDLMKIAEVITLHKGKARDNGSNYRPISLLTTMSKVLEKVVYTRVYKFLTDTGQLCDTQYGFRSQHSCEHAVSQLIGTVLKNMENQKTTVSVMLDLSKAFDTIEHEIMLKKLALYGVRGTCLDWFRSYLTNRELKVRCKTACSQEEICSNSHIVNYGTPQGSSLGPLIFLIFVNDMYLHLTDVISIQFTDDTTILFGHRNKTYVTVFPADKPAPVSR